MRTPQLFPDVGLRRTMCILSHFRTCDVRAEVRAERVCNCACVVGASRHIFDLRCAIALFALFGRLFEKKPQKINLKIYFFLLFCKFFIHFDCEP